VATSVLETGCARGRTAATTTLHHGIFAACVRSQGQSALAAAAATAADMLAAEVATAVVAAATAAAAAVGVRADGTASDLETGCAHDRTVTTTILLPGMCAACAQRRGLQKVVLRLLAPTPAEMNKVPVAAAAASIKAVASLVVVVATSKAVHSGAAVAVKGGRGDINATIYLPKYSKLRFTPANQTPFQKRPKAKEGEKEGGWKEGWVEENEKKEKEKEKKEKEKGKITKREGCDRIHFSFFFLSLSLRLEMKQGEERRDKGRRNWER